MRTKKISMILALLCTVAQGAWADEVTTDGFENIGTGEQVFTTLALVVIIISVAVVILAFITKQAVLAWRDGEIAHRANEGNRKKSDELLDKYLGLLEKETELGVYDGDEYRETLARLVDLSQKGKLSEITEDALNAIFKTAGRSKSAKR